MSTLTSLARARAALTGCAQPIATVRHVHVADRPLVFIPLTMAGEANAPLAAMVGDDPAAPRLLVVPQPRNRDQRFDFAASLAGTFLSYVDSFAGAVETLPGGRGQEPRIRYAGAPQILVPNPGGIAFTRLFGRSTRFRRTEGDHAVAPSVPVLGRWLTFLAEQAERPGSCLLLAATDALALHWASGQSMVEDQNLASLMAWIAPPDGLSAEEAALVAEDPTIHPPAGPTTDPGFDNGVLAPLIEAYGAAPDEGARHHTVRKITVALRGQLEPTWRLMWHAVDLLRAVPAGQRVAARWDADRDAYTVQVRNLRDGGPPQPRRDGAVGAARRLNRLELAKASYDAQRALDDPLILAEYRLTGEAFAGTVVEVEPGRLVSNGNRRTLRPLITVSTGDPLRARIGDTVSAVDRPNQKAVVRDRVPEGGSTWVVLELSGGMGRSLTPPPGSVPEVGERVSFTGVADSYQPVAAFPGRDDTPWTHGGPPEDHPPTDQDSTEEWR